MSDQKKGERGSDTSNRSPETDERNNHDPYERDPGAGNKEDERVNEADELAARQREGVQLNSTDRLDDSTTAPAIHTGIPGQTSRGSYGIDSTTGQGAYMDHARDGAADVGTDPLDQPADRFATNEGTIDGDDLIEEEIRP